MTKRKTSLTKKSPSDYIAARKVYVVMENDFPLAVYRRERAATDCAATKRLENDRAMEKERMTRPIYYRVYPFKLL